MNESPGPESPEHIRTLERSAVSSEEYELVPRKVSLCSNQKIVQTLEMYYTRDSSPEKHVEKEQGWNTPGTGDYQVGRIICPNPLFEFCLKDRNLIQSEENEIIRGLFEGSSIREITIERVNASQTFLADLMSSSVHLEKISVFRLGVVANAAKPQLEGSSVKTLGASPIIATKPQDSGSSTHRHPLQTTGWVSADLSGKELREAEFRGCWIESVTKVGKNLQILNFTDCSVKPLVLQQIQKLWKFGGVVLNLTRLQVQDSQDGPALVSGSVSEIISKHTKLKRVYTSLVLDCLDPKSAEGLATALILNCSLEYFGFSQQSRPLEFRAEDKSQPQHNGQEHLSGWNWSLTGVSPIYGGDWTKFLQRVILANRFVCREGLPNLTKLSEQSLLHKMANFGLAAEVQSIVQEKLKAYRKTHGLPNEPSKSLDEVAAAENRVIHKLEIDEEEENLLLKEIAQRQLIDLEHSPNNLVLRRPHAHHRKSSRVPEKVPLVTDGDQEIPETPNGKHSYTYNSETSRMAKELNESEDEKQLRCIRELELATRSGELSNRRFERDLNREVRMDLAAYTGDKGFYEDEEDDYELALISPAHALQPQLSVSRNQSGSNPRPPRRKTPQQQAQGVSQHKSRRLTPSKPTPESSQQTTAPKQQHRSKSAKHLKNGRKGSVTGVSRSVSRSKVLTGAAVSGEGVSGIAGVSVGNAGVFGTPVGGKGAGEPGSKAARGGSPFLAVRKKLDMDSKEGDGAAFVSVHQSVVNAGKGVSRQEGLKLQHHRIKTELPIKQKSVKRRSGSPKLVTGSKIGPEKAAKPLVTLQDIVDKKQMRGVKKQTPGSPRTKLLAPPMSLLPQFTLGAHLPGHFKAPITSRSDHPLVPTKLQSKPAKPKSKVTNSRKYSRPKDKVTTGVDREGGANKENEGWRANKVNYIQVPSDLAQGLARKRSGSRSKTPKLKNVKQEVFQPRAGFDSSPALKALTKQAVMLTTEKERFPRGHN